MELEILNDFSNVNTFSQFLLKFDQSYHDKTVNLYLLHGIFVRCDQLLLVITYPGLKTQIEAIFNIFNTRASYDLLVSNRTIFSK